MSEYEIQECNRTINEEMERKKEYYDTDDEDDYDQMIEGLGFQTLTSAELEAKEMEEVRRSEDEANTFAFNILEGSSVAATSYPICTLVAGPKHLPGQ